MLKPEADFVFEASWEVCNKVGGIYTVIKSKVAEMMKIYPNYILIGPYFENNAKLDFISLDIPQEYKSIFDSLSKEGIRCHYGKWADDKAKPLTILIDFQGILGQKDRIKEMFWNDYRVDSLRGYWDFEEPSLWSYAAGRLIEKFKDGVLRDKNVVAHFHEWLSGFGLLYVEKNCPTVATVFTTHATTLGRTIAGNGMDLYHMISSIDPLREAYNNNVESKHLTEAAAAQHADAFTTVSEVTALEAEKFLGRRPEVVLHNGLDIEKFPSFEDTSIKHITSRDKIREFVTYYFFPYYTFDVSHTLIFYTVGRYEFRNKGYDILIKSLGQLNQQLKLKRAANPEDQRTIAMIFWIPMDNHGIKLDVLENKNYYMHIKNYVNANAPEILTRLIYDFIANKEEIDRNLFTENFINEIRKDIVAFERNGYPPLSTHNIDESNNKIILALKENGLMNRKDDIIKTIVEPVYLDGTDGFIDLTYYDAMVGCHLGLFPSYYEPWGYTPLESAALGVPAITTDLSGFGMFIKNKNSSKSGIMVLERYNKNEDDVIINLTKMLSDFSNLTHGERVECKLNAKKMSGIADWKVLIEDYVLAHNIALQNNDAKNKRVEM